MFGPRGGRGGRPGFFSGGHVLPGEGGEPLTSPEVPLVDLRGESRQRAVPVLLDCFTGVYRWHAKRTLREVSTVRAALVDERVVGLTMLETLAPEVGYVYYVAVERAHRGRGIAGQLLDDALTRFRNEGRAVVYVATEEGNVPMSRALERRGFRRVATHELGYAEGGLGAWGLRSRMTLVSGEVLMGLRLRAHRSVGIAGPGGPTTGASGPGRMPGRAGLGSRSRSSSAAPGRTASRPRSLRRGDGPVRPSPAGTRPPACSGPASTEL